MQNGAAEFVLRQIKSLPPTVVLNDTSKPVQPTSTVDPLKSNQTERFVRRALCNNFLKLVDFKNYIVKK
jgi:hypothetical protein